MNARGPKRTEDVGAAAQLNELFGGSWVAWSADPDGVAIAARFTADTDGRQALTGLILVGDAITAQKLREVSVTELERQASLAGKSERQMRAELRKLPPLRRDGVPPEEFAERVAAHYRIWAQHTASPAASMAEEWNVKAPTMAGWIREARLRGLLPPARGRSKVGRVPIDPATGQPMTPDQVADILQGMRTGRYDTSKGGNA